MSEPLTDLSQILATMTVTERGRWVYAVDLDVPKFVKVLARISEDEGETVIVDAEQADSLGLGDEPVFTCLTLQVHSALESVGLTKTVSELLADNGIPCNILAGYYHDHLLVPADKAASAKELLEALAESKRISKD